MPARPDLQLRLLGPTVVMFAGAALPVVATLLMEAVPIAVTRFAALLVVLGAGWQLWTLHRHLRRWRNAGRGSG